MTRSKLSEAVFLIFGLTACAAALAMLTTAQVIAANLPCMGRKPR